MGSVNLRLAKGFEQTIRMRVEHVSAEENGQAAVVLSCRKYLAQTTLLRHQAADVVLHTYEGLRVPSNALRVSETGVTGVYCVDGENASFPPGGTAVPGGELRPGQARRGRVRHPDAPGGGRGHRHRRRAVRRESHSVI